MSLTDATVIITESGGLYTLAHNGVVLRTSSSPRELSRYAFAQGALAVEHRYDLGKADT